MKTTVKKRMNRYSISVGLDKRKSNKLIESLGGKIVDDSRLYTVFESPLEWNTVRNHFAPANIVVGRSHQ